MPRLVIASHGLMAQGIQSTLELFVGSDRPITYMSAYVEGQLDIDQQITEYFQSVEDNDQVIIFTDLFGGSVNQKLLLAANERPNTFLVAGFNLPLLIEVAVSDEELTQEQLTALIETSRQSLQQVPLTNGENNEKSKRETQQPVVNEERDPAAVAVDDTQLSSSAHADKLMTTLRVDERLIHGQIAMVWSRALHLDGIIVANDEVADNEAQQMALKMAVPAGVKVLIRPVDEVATILHDPRAYQKRLLVLVRTVQDAWRLTQKVSDFAEINIGNVGKSVNGEKRTLTQFVMLTEKEYEALKAVVSLYPHTALQNLPSDKKLLAKDKIKE
ncbi:MAG: PTS sugar transporter subunit IIB [Aerococcus sp.]|nr:PTS sugar transporter subunit IIB [Aerococcus sp.]